MGTSRNSAELKGVVFDVQRYSLGDGPGIRTTVFLKGCPLRCRWCQNPESISSEPEIAFDRERCIDDHSCQAACPRQAIAPGFGYRVDPGRCDRCGACVRACPSGALTTIGRRMTVDELLEIVLRDAAFYAESGGGVTLSGGEPTSQFAFAVALLKACKRAGIHTAIETSGFVGRDRLSRLLEWLDDVYYDLKVISPEQHRVFTGVDNAPILSNARWLSRSGAKVTFRVPLVPGMTMTEPNVAAMVSFIAALRVRQIDLCPYQSGWRRKLERVGPIQDSLAIAPPSSEQVQAVVAAFGAAGIEVRMSGDSS